MQRSLVVVGGGFAGMYAALAASRVGAGQIDVSLVSRVPRLVMRPRLYEADPKGLTADFATSLVAAGVSLIEDEAIGLETHSVRLRAGGVLRCDRAVLATGSVMRAPALPGCEHTYSIDDLPSALRFDDRLREVARLPAPIIAVVGAGFTGIELVLELRDRLAAHGAPHAGGDARVLLVDRKETPGAEFGETLEPIILESLAEANVELHMRAEIAGFEADGIFIRNGQRIQAHATILCTGLAAAPLPTGTAGERDAFGRVIVDQYLRIPADPQVFCAGDSALAECAPGRLTLMSCQHALTTGRFAGENAGRDLLGLPLIPYSQPRYVTCLDLGRSGAVFSEGWERRPRYQREEGKAIKHRINRTAIYPPLGTAADILAASEIRS